MKNETLTTDILETTEISEVVAAPKVIVSAPKAPKAPSFEDFDFLPEILRTYLKNQNIVTPTSIQAKAIPAALEKRDVLAQSHTGSGKTLAFAIPMGMLLAGTKCRQPRALVLTPTRELATQVAQVLTGALSALKLRVLAITGGASYIRQKRSLSDGIDVVVGTPGRINDLLTQGNLDLSQLQMYVLDEVDQMLDVGFADALNKIKEKITSPVQTMFFSATLSHDIRSLAKSLLKNPIEILVNKADAHGPSTIKHGYLEVRNGSEQRALINTLLFHNPERALIFCKTRQECGELAEALGERGFNSAALHGELSQQERNDTMNRFREKRLQYLISTNVAARGIDVQDLPLVVNFNVPFDMESYTHRVGRTGRNGAEGQAWTIVTPQTCRGYEFLMRKMKIKPGIIEVPSAQEVIHRSTDSMLTELQTRETPANRTVEKAVVKALTQLNEEDKDKLLRAFLIKQLEKLGSYYNDEIVCQKPLVRLDLEPSNTRESSFRKSGGGSSFSSRKPFASKYAYSSVAKGNKQHGVFSAVSASAALNKVAKSSAPKSLAP